MMKLYFHRITLLCGLTVVSSLHAFSLPPSNFFKPYDVNYRLEPWPKGVGKMRHVQLGGTYEQGSTRDCRNFDTNRGRLLSIFHPTESAIAALKGSEPGSDAANLLLDLHNPTDDGVRGHFLGRARYQEWQASVYARYNFHITGFVGYFDFSFYVPFLEREFKRVAWADQTRQTTGSDLLVKDMLTKDIATLLQELGGLDIGNWSNRGMGDPVFMLGWQHDFLQHRRVLDNVRLALRVGLSLPFASQRDEDKALSMPLGNDGAYAVPMTLGMDVFMRWHLKAGIEFELLKLFDTTRTRRLKTSQDQTDFFLLHKGRARKKYGTTWKFNIYIGAHHMLRGLSAKIIYRYIRHDEDRLFAKTSEFNNDIINTAATIQDWQVQDFVFQLSYDFFKDAPKFFIKPQLSAFYKLPVAGRRSIDPHTFGAQLAFNF